MSSELSQQFLLELHHGSETMCIPTDKKTEKKKKKERHFRFNFPTPPRLSSNVPPKEELSLKMPYGKWSNVRDLPCGGWGGGVIGGYVGGGGMLKV